MKKIAKTNILDNKLKELKQEIKEVNKPCKLDKTIKKVSKKQLVWKLLRCKSETCKSIHNRDVNATKNMEKILEYVIKTGTRPKKYTRPEKNR